MEVTREQLADAIRRTAVRAREGGLKYLGDGTVSAHALDPDGLAADLLSDCAGQQADGDEFAATAAVADPELSAMARVLAELDALSGESGAGMESAVRALTWLAGRYGYVLATED
jgi:hypothetical protein